MDDTLPDEPVSALAVYVALLMARKARIDEIEAPEKPKDEFLPQEPVAGYEPKEAVMLALDAGIEETADAVKFLSCLRAIEDGDVPKMREAFANGIDPNMNLGRPYRNFYRFAAERTTNIHCLRTLIEAGGGSVDAGILITLAWRGFIDDVVRFVGQGPSLDFAHGDTSVLGAAVCRRNVQGVKRLLELGASVDFTMNAQGPWGTSKKVTPLMIAALCGHDEVAQILLQGGADITRVDSTGRGAMHWAKVCSDKKSRNKIIKVLEAAGLSAQDAPDLPEISGLAIYGERAKTAEFKATLELAQKLTGEEGFEFVLQGPPVEGATGFPINGTKNSLELLRALREEMKSGMAFVSSDGNRECILVLPVVNLAEAITALETPNGQNISSDDFIAWMKETEKDNPIDVTHLTPDRLEGDFLAEIRDPENLARRIHEICDEGEGPMDPYILQTSRHLFLWWD